MKKSKIFTISIDLFNAKIHVLYACSDEEVKDYMNSNFPDAVYERVTHIAAVTFVCDHQVCGSEYVIDIIEPLYQKSFKQNVISHESSHVAWEIMHDRGIHADHAHQEEHAYILGYIVQKINENI